MGLADRDYARRPAGPSGPFGPRGVGLPGPRGFSRFSVNTWIIIVNVTVFVIGGLLAGVGLPVWMADDVVIDDTAAGSLGEVQEYRVGANEVSSYGAKGLLVTIGENQVPIVVGVPERDLRRLNNIVYRQLVDTSRTVNVAGTEQPLPVGVREYRVMDPIQALGHFSTAKAFFWIPTSGLVVLGLEVWRLVTFQFLHANLTHIVMNMLGLYFFGPIVEQFLGRKKYAAFYLMCGICGGLLYLLLNLLGLIGIPLPGALHVDASTPLVGASAGVFGVLMACAVIAPDVKVQLIFPPIPMKMRTMAYIFLGIALFNLLIFKGSNQGGDAAHVGGALAGFFFIKRSHLLRDFFDIFGGKKRGAKPGKRGGRAPSAAADREIDAILTKIQKSGIHSLSASEKAALARASEDRRG